jgi:hypothetical protein
MGQDGYLLDHEIFLYVFDAMLMFITMVLFNVFHPSRIIGADFENIGRDVEEVDGEYALADQTVRIGLKK